MSCEIIALADPVQGRAGIARAAEALSRGGLVIFPTETVYGVAANASNNEAVERLYRLKHDAEKQPLTVHIAHREDALKFNPHPPAIGKRLMRKGWPGPLSLVFVLGEGGPPSADISLSEAGRAAIFADDRVRLRCPDHAVATSLLFAAACPTVATSVNLAGQPAPTSADAIAPALLEQADFLLDGGQTKYSQGSTVVEVGRSGYRLLRAGVWDERTINRMAQLNILFVCSGNTCRSPMAEGLFKKMAAEKLGCAVEDLPSRGIATRSAGTMAGGGGGAAAEAIEVCRRRDVDISHHRSRGVDMDLIGPADYIYAMGRGHLSVLRSIAPTDAAKMDVLDPDGGEIADPLGGTLADYERAADRIAAALARRIEEVPL